MYYPIVAAFALRTGWTSDYLPHAPKTSQIMVPIRRFLQP